MIEPLPNPLKLKSRKLKCKWSLSLPFIPASDVEEELIIKMSDQILAEAILTNLKNGVPLEVELAGCGWETIERIAQNNKELRDYLHNPTLNTDLTDWLGKVGEKKIK